MEILPESLALDPQYKNLCKTVAMFALAKGLDEDGQSQLSTLIALAIRIGSNHAND
jgi:hypothetical protein